MPSETIEAPEWRDQVTWTEPRPTRMNAIVAGIVNPPAQVPLHERYRTFADLRTDEPYTVYIAGPMRDMECFNFPLFDEAAIFCRSTFGWLVISPAEYDRQVYPDIEEWPGFKSGADPAWEDGRHAAMAWDLEQVAKSNAIVLLPGWECSEGANHELDVALACGKDVYLYASGDAGGLGRTVALITPDELRARRAVTGAGVSAVETRTFATGATRHSAEGKPNYEAYLSPTVIRRFGEYMQAHSVDRDGNPRAGDNWQQGFPLEVLMESGWRHWLDLWLLHRGEGVAHDYDDGEPVDIEDALCGVLFNVQAYLHEILKARK